jgi:pimeloyl-ACP methyl ester carboxylesterase
MSTQAPEPASSGYAEAAEGLRIYYEAYGEGEPIVVLAGALMPIKTMAQVIGPLSKRRQVIAIDLEGHGRTGLRDTPMSHERNGNDVAAVLRHLGISQADVAGYSHGGDAVINLAIRHPEMVRNLIVIATAFSRDGWYPEGQEGMSSINGSLANHMKTTPFYEGYGHPDQFSLFLDRMGELGSKDWNWREEVRALPMPVLLIFADHDSVSMRHIAEFFALFGGGIREPGWIDPQFSRTAVNHSRLFALQFGPGAGGGASDREVSYATNVGSDAVRTIGPASSSTEARIRHVSSCAPGCILWRRRCREVLNH